jgi:hypothetical protein
MLSHHRPWSSLIAPPVNYRGERGMCMGQIEIEPWSKLGTLDMPWAMPLLLPYIAAAIHTARAYTTWFPTASFFPHIVASRLK